MEWHGFEDEDTLPALERFLEQRIATRNTLLQDFAEKGTEQVHLPLQSRIDCLLLPVSENQFRQRLVSSEQELVLVRAERDRLKSGWDGEKRRVRDLESRLVNAESANTSLQRKVTALGHNELALENEVSALLLFTNL